MTVPGWKVVFFLVVVFLAAAEEEEEVEEEEAAGAQMEDLEEDREEGLEEVAHPGMEVLDVEEVDHLGMLVQMGFPHLLHAAAQTEAGLLLHYWVRDLGPGLGPQSPASPARASRRGPAPP